MISVVNLHSLQREPPRASLGGWLAHLPDFGVRLEVNVFAKEQGVQVTGEMQTEFVRPWRL